MFEKNKSIKNEILTNEGIIKVLFVHNKIKVFFDNNENAVNFIWKYQKSEMEYLKNDISLNIYGRTKNGIYNIDNSIFYFKYRDFKFMEDNIVVFTKMPEKYLELSIS